MTAPSLQGHTRDHPGALWERTEPLARARTLLGRARAGAGGLLVIRGATGSGRTAVLEAVARDAARTGTTVLHARCSDQEADAAFGVVLQMFDTLLHGKSAVPWLTDGAGWDGSLYGAGLPSRLWSALRSHTAQAPVLLAVDDVHLADAPSRRWLAQVARRLDRLPVLLAVTERWQYDLVLPGPAFTDRCGRPAAGQCTLGPLGPAAAAGVVRDVLGKDVPRPLTDECVHASGGNPMLLHALLADLYELATDGPLPLRLPVSRDRLHHGSFGAAVTRWLHSAGAETRTAARVLAELQDEEDVLTFLPQVAGSDPSRIDGWIGELTRQGLLRPTPPDGRPAFAHPLLREAVRNTVDRHQRMDVHRRTAELLHSRGDRDDAVVRYLLSVPAVGEPWAVDALLAAAARAVRAGRTGEAIACLRRVLEEPLSVRRRGEALTELGCLEAQDERPCGVRHLAEALRLQRNVAGKVRAAASLGAALVARGEVHTALDVLGDLSDEFTGSTDLAHAVQAATALVASHDGDSWLRVVAELRRIGAQAPERLAPTAQALLTEYGATAGHLSAADVMERARALMTVPLDPLLEPYLLASTATLAQWADELPEADRWVARGLAAHRLPKLHPGRQSLLSVHAESLVMRGRYRALLADTSLWGTRTGWQAGTLSDNAHLNAQALVALTETGRLTEAARLADAVTARGTNGSWEWSEFLYARGMLRLASGDPGSALADFLECGSRQSARQVVSPVVTPWRSAAADCYLALGSPEHAVPLATEERRLARIWATPRTVGRALRALAASLGGRHGLELAQQAVTVLRNTAEPLPELIPALLSLGTAFHRCGQRLQAREVLREAAQRAERTEAVRLRLAAQEALRGCGARPRRTRHTGSVALTPSERRVALLVVAGHSNSEIAALLHVAVRTVETHLTHGYRKLGIRGRADLAAALKASP
ncbi:AAA family ATPase [Streptomyces netropsis]|uniref:AAA family ATPase n=1 Tax=Streptomyces netropsis TaxID=55404 RepID=UPI0030D128E6